MHDYTPSSLAFTGPVVVFGLAVGQQAIVGAALVIVGVAAFGIRNGWRRHKSISEA